MREDERLYYYMRRYLSPMESYEIVKRKHPKTRYSMMDFESMKLKTKFKVRAY